MSGPYEFGALIGSLAIWIFIGYCERNRGLRANRGVCGVGAMIGGVIG